MEHIEARALVARRRPAWLLLAPCPTSRLDCRVALPKVLGRSASSGSLPRSGPPSKGLDRHGGFDNPLDVYVETANLTLVVELVDVHRVDHVHLAILDVAFFDLVKDQVRTLGNAPGTVILNPFAWANLVMKSM